MTRTYDKYIFLMVTLKKNRIHSLQKNKIKCIVFVFECESVPMFIYQQFTCSISHTRQTFYFLKELHRLPHELSNPLVLHFQIHSFGFIRESEQVELWLKVLRQIALVEMAQQSPGHAHEASGEFVLCPVARAPVFLAFPPQDVL